MSFKDWLSGKSTKGPMEIPFFEYKWQGDAPKEDSRFEVELVGQFKDALAYDGMRGVYIIRDKENGIEYVGVSGIGIAERGLHSKQVGKHRQTIEDER